VVLVALLQVFSPDEQAIEHYEQVGVLLTDPKTNNLAKHLRHHLHRFEQQQQLPLPQRVRVLKDEELAFQNVEVYHAFFGERMQRVEHCASAKEDPTSCNPVMRRRPTCVCNVRNNSKEKKRLSSLNVQHEKLQKKKANCSDRVSVHSSVINTLSTNARPNSRPRTGSRCHMSARVLCVSSGCRNSPART
jgi:hypothetical protein